MNIKNIKIIVTTSTHSILLQKNKSEIQGNKFTQQYFFKKLHITIFISLKFLMNNFSFKQELRERGKRCIERIRCWQNHVVFFAANWNSSPQISTTLFSFIEVHPLKLEVSSVISSSSISFNSSSLVSKSAFSYVLWWREREREREREGGGGKQRCKERLSDGV
jgi:hypothetical protein